MKNVKNMLLVLFVVGIFFMVGCSSPKTGVISDPIEEPTVPVVRSFSASTTNVGDTITVTLTKRLDASQTNILVEENFPAGWTVVNAGSGSAVGNTIRWAELTGATSGTFIYTVTVGGSSGTATWNGQYSINGQTPSDIGGSTSVVVN